MTDLVQVEVQGLDKVQTNLQRAAAKLRGPGLEPAMKAATLAVTRDAKLLAPVDTGNLRASIKPEIRCYATALEGVVGSPVTYAPFQELGTAHMKGRHYLQRAFDKSKAAIENLLKRGVEGIVKEANE